MLVSAIQECESAISKSEREKYTHRLLTHIYGVRKRKQTNKTQYWWTYLQGRNRDSDVENRLVDTVAEGESGKSWVSSSGIYSLYASSVFLSWVIVSLSNISSLAFLLMCSPHDSYVLPQSKSQVEMPCGSFQHGVGVHSFIYSTNTWWGVCTQGQTLSQETVSKRKSSLLSCANNLLGRMVDGDINHHGFCTVLPQTGVLWWKQFHVLKAERRTI